METNNYAISHEAPAVTLSGDDYNDFLAWQAGKRDRRIADLKEKHKEDIPPRRNTIVLRRVDGDSIAPDEDVLAYIIIYEMKKPLTDPKKKVSVTDNEIRAYLSLDGDFIETPTLQAIEAKVKEMFGDNAASSSE